MVGSPEPLLADAEMLTAVLTGTGLRSWRGSSPWLPWLAQSPSKKVLVMTGMVRPVLGGGGLRELAGCGDRPVAWDPVAARWWSHGESAEAGGSLGGSFPSVRAFVVGPVGG